MQHGTGGGERVCLCVSVWEEGESLLLLVVVVVPYTHHEGYHEYDPRRYCGPASGSGDI